MRQLILAESASLYTGTTSSPCLSPPPRREDASLLYLSRRAPPASSRSTNNTYKDTHRHTHDSPRIFVYSFIFCLLIFLYIYLSIHYSFIYLSSRSLVDLFTNAMTGRYRTRLLIYQIHKRALSSSLPPTDRSIDPSTHRPTECRSSSGTDKSNR